MVKMIAMVSPSGHIGLDGRLLYSDAEDMSRFRRLTMGGTVVMGSRTWGSLRAPLQGRQNVVLSRRRDSSSLCSTGADAAYSGLQEALWSLKAAGETDVWIIGGAKLYREALLTAEAEEVHLSVAKEPATGDASIDMRLVRASYDLRSSEDATGHTYEVWVRKPSAVTTVEAVGRSESDILHTVLSTPDSWRASIWNPSDAEERQSRYDVAYARMSQVWAGMSHCEKRKVGCLVVRDNMIVSDGFNGTPTGHDNRCEDESGDTLWEVLHAEANAIAKLARAGNHSDGATMYATLSPCRDCAKLIYQAGIRRLVVLSLSRHVDALQMLVRCGVRVEVLDPDGRLAKHDCCEHC